MIFLFIVLLGLLSITLPVSAIWLYRRHETHCLEADNPNNWEVGVLTTRGGGKRWVFVYNGKIAFNEAYVDQKQCVRALQRHRERWNDNVNWHDKPTTVKSD